MKANHVLIAWNGYLLIFGSTSNNNEQYDNPDPVFHNEMTTTISDEDIVDHKILPAFHSDEYGNPIWPTENPFLVKTDMECNDFVCDDFYNQQSHDTYESHFALAVNTLTSIGIIHYVGTDPPNPYDQKAAGGTFSNNWGDRANYICWAYFISMPAYEYKFKIGDVVNEQF